MTFGYSTFDLERVPPVAHDGRRWQPTAAARTTTSRSCTLDDAPLPGVLVNRDGRQYYWPNLGGGRLRQGPPARDERPLVSGFARSGLAFIDLDGSGTSDLMVADPERDAGVLPQRRGRRDGTDSCRSHREVRHRGGRTRRPGCSTPTPTVLSTPSPASEAACGGGATSASRVGPMPSWPCLPTWRASISPPADVHLADMTGDGSSDLVRVTSGRVEYWPSLGNGRFGARVVMRNCPRITHRAPWATAVLLDLDGDGCADLVVPSMPTV